MVVVVIIGILVAIAIPIYSGIQARAEATAIEATERTLSGAYQVWLAEDETGNFPEDYVVTATGDENTVTMPDYDGTFVRNTTTNLFEHTP